MPSLQDFKGCIFTDRACTYSTLFHPTHFPYTEYEQAERVIEEMRNVWIKIKQ